MPSLPLLTVPLVPLHGATIATMVRFFFISRFAFGFGLAPEAAPDGSPGNTNGGYLGASQGRNPGAKTKIPKTYKAQIMKR